MKQGIDALRGLRYNLRMMGIPISSPSYIYEDNIWLYIIHLDQSHYSERKAMQFVAMQSVSGLLRANP